MALYSSFLALLGELIYLHANITTGTYYDSFILFYSRGMARGRSAAFMRELRRKHGLREFATKAKRRKSPKPRSTRRHRRARGRRTSSLRTLGI